VTSLMLEHFGVPSSAQDMRRRERARSEAIDGLAGRTVWCAAAVPERGSAAEALRSRWGRGLRSHRPPGHRRRRAVA
jgi:hypothetical protein